MIEIKSKISYQNLFVILKFGTLVVSFVTLPILPVLLNGSKIETIIRICKKLDKLDRFR